MSTFTPDPTGSGPTSKTGHVMLAPSAIREAVDRTKATLLAASSSTVASLDAGHRIPVDHLWYLIDTATALLEHDCPAVSPAPDTDSENLAAYIESWLKADTDEQLPDDWFEDTARRLAVSLNEDVLGGLRADLDQARAERDSMVRDLLQAIYPGDPMPDRPLDTVWNHLLEQVRQQETRYHALAASAVRDREEVKVLRAGARPIPDDAAERFDALLDAAGSLLAHLVTGERGHPGEPCIRTHWVPEKRYAQYVAAVQAARDWRDALLADLGATPTTGPAPAAADDEQRESAGDLLRALACAIALLKTHVDDSRCAPSVKRCIVHHWSGEGDCNVARTRAFLVGASWVPDYEDERFDWAEAAETLVHPEPAAPQAPAEPTTLGPTSTWPVNYQPRPDASCPACRKGRQHSIGDVHEHHGDRIPELRAASRAAAPHEYVDSEAIIRATPAAREDAATPEAAPHEVEVTNLPGGWSSAYCHTCKDSSGERSDDGAEEWADQHRADNLGGWRRPAPIRHEEE